MERLLFFSLEKQGYLFTADDQEGVEYVEVEKS